MNIKLNSGAVMLCAGLFLGGTAAAQSAEDCRSGGGPALMNACAGQEYEAADAALNTAWTSAKSFADVIGQGRALLEAQRAWLTYRDAACTVHASQFEGGSLQPWVLTNCMSDLTKARTAMLLEFNPY